MLVDARGGSGQPGEGQPARAQTDAARSPEDSDAGHIPTVAVLGNPNAGKSTVFNRLTGLSQKVGNYPGVTVERKEGFVELGGRKLRVLDLPGTYSLAAHSLDEIVAVDVLLGHQQGESRPDLVLHVVDSSNLERNLYLLTQICELGLPVLVVLNMVDVAQRKGLHIDAEKLSECLGLPVVSTQAHRGTGVDELKRTIHDLLESLERNGPGQGGASFAKGLAVPEDLRREVAELHREMSPRVEHELGRDLHPFEVLRVLVDREGYAERRFAGLMGETFHAELEAARARAGQAFPLPMLEARCRYALVREKVDGCKRRHGPSRPSWSERLDSVLTHKVFGVVIFALMMLIVFQSIFTWAAPALDLIDTAFGELGSWVAGLLPEGTLSSLLVDGVIAGVGGVVIFLPQILILFLFIGLLEDCGYMARAAFIMDKVMSKCGLSGKSFIPMLSGFACAVPAIMAARVIESRRDRIATILVTPLMSCSARLPVYAILIGTFIPDVPIAGGLLGLQAATLFGLYVLGIVVAVAMAWVFKKTILRGTTPPFVLELPSYKIPSLGTVLLRLFDRAKAFLVRAGTIILTITIVVWALSYFPRPASIAASYDEQRQETVAQLEALSNDQNASRAELEERASQLNEEEAGAYLRQSFFGRMGHAVEPIFAPLGWDWKISMAALASFPAREVVVSTLGTIYNFGADAEEETQQLGERLREERWPDSDRPVFTIPVALSIMVFFALCCQCGATVATIRRETSSWGWAWFTFVYMTGLAYVGAFLTFQVGSRFFSGT